MFRDTVEEDKLLHQPKFLALLFVFAFLAFILMDLSQTFVGYLLEWVIGDPESSGIYGRLVVAFTLAILFVLNLIFISFLQFRFQVMVVWFELLILFLLFFYSFELSMAFIQKKLPILLTQGVFTTLYISALGIMLASVLAIIGAIAKLSSNGFAYSIASFYTSLF